MADKADDLDAVRTIVSALEPFEPDDQRRIIRWSMEKIGLSAPTADERREAPSPRSDEERDVTDKPHPTGIRDIRTFISEKNPTTDNQFAAAVAYYYRFKAAESERKDSITAEDLQEACRRVGRRRLNRPSQTLVNAHAVGLVDKAERGSYRINAVGENLVAMTLPSGATTKPTTVGRKPLRRASRSSVRKSFRKSR
ncbi:MAG TPA: hypothetical protein VFB33_11660 [Candidatus Binataceae bacterium]|nr:hypothetical protein [Candidatus Binataceae bacterium]